MYMNNGRESNITLRYKSSIRTAFIAVLHLTQLVVDSKTDIFTM